MILRLPKSTLFPYTTLFRSLKLRKKRFKNGAISFESEEVQFKLDEKGKPLGVFARERKEAHMLIEDFMLLANRSVAEFIGKKGRSEEHTSELQSRFDLVCRL